MPRQTHHVVIGHMDDQKVSLYTNDLKLQRNRKGVCLTTLGISVFFGCIYTTLVSMRRAEDVATDSFNHSAWCNITHARAHEFDDEFRFVVMNPLNETACAAEENGVVDIEDQRLLSTLNLSIGSVIQCYCGDHIYFSRTNSIHSESVAMHLFGGGLLFFGFVACVITAAASCVMMGKDRHIFYAKQWYYALDGHSKYKYIIDHYTRMHNASLCSEIEDLIFDYTDGMAPTRPPQEGEAETLL